MGIITQPKKKKCTKCEKERFLSRDYYMSNSDKHADRRIGVCKQCINKNLETDSADNFMTEDFINKVQDTLLDMNRPYIHSVWVESVEEVKQRKHTRVFGIYLKNLLLNHKDKNSRDSEYVDINDTNDNSNKEYKNDSDPKKRIEEKYDIELDTKNEEDVLRLLGYDPFEHEAESDRYSLFNKLIEYLDETTMEDGFRLSSCLEIVKTLNQIDKINIAITNAMNDTTNFSRNAGSITALVNAKDKMLGSTMKLAQENRISLRHTSSKSTGAGTLSGIIKQLQEYGIEEADTNLFDIETGVGLRQVANLSNQSILQQLQLDENDYVEMISSQRQLINEYKEKSDKFEEENRLLRKEIVESGKRDRTTRNKKEAVLPHE